jgi:hypothetical protein
MPPAVPAPKPEIPAVNRKEFGFGKTPAGADALIVFGKEVPVPIAVAVVGGAGALLLVLRAKANGGNIVSAGTTPAAATTASSTAYDPDAEAIADLQNALTSMSSQIQGLQAAATSTLGSYTTPMPTSGPVPTETSGGYVGNSSVPLPAGMTATQAAAISPSGEPFGDLYQMDVSNLGYTPAQALSAIDSPTNTPS